jgi:SAM-dependent methyltransferase
MEWILAGQLLHRCRTAFLADAATARNALLLGEGPGRYLVELIRVNPAVQVTCLDSSPRMLQIARRRLHQARLPDDRVRFLCADLWHAPLDRCSVDLIASHVFLDCFQASELPLVIAKIAESASPAAHWIISDFQLPPAGWQRVRAQWILRAAYLFFRFTTHLSATQLTRPDLFLEQNGFRVAKRRVFNHGLLYAAAWTR